MEQLGKTSSIALLIASIVFGALFALLFTVYVWTDYRSAMFLSSQPSLNEVQEKWGPELTPRSPSDLEYEGWELPKAIPAGTKAVWIYDSTTGRRYFIFIDKAHERVLSWFSSSS